MNKRRAAVRVNALPRSSAHTGGELCIVYTIWLHIRSKSLVEKAPIRAPAEAFVRFNEVYRHARTPTRNKRHAVRCLYRACITRAKESRARFARARKHA